jgi:hypothetical protein
MGTVLLSPGVNPIAVKNIILYHISYPISYHSISQFRDGNDNAFIENKYISESVVNRRRCVIFF